MTDPQRQLLLLIVLTIPCVLILGGGVGCFSLYALLVRRLKLEQNAVWVSLGSPSAFPGLPLPGVDYWYGAVFDWMLRRDYRSLSDPSLVRLAGSCRVLFLSIFAGLGCIAVLVVASLVIIMAGI